MAQQPHLGIAGTLTPILRAAWDEQLRDIERASSKEELAESHYRVTCWLGALVQGRVIATASAVELRNARDKAHQLSEIRLDAET